MAMTLKALALTAALFFGSSISSAATAQTIQFESGPIDGLKMVTPWGNYIAVNQGNSVWVGTEAQYDHAMARAAMAATGGRELCAHGAHDCNTFVEADLPRVYVGDNEVAGITVDTLFGEKPNLKIHRLPKPATSEYVAFSWEQTLNKQVSVIIWDADAKHAYKPYDRGEDMGTNHCEFILPRAALTHKTTVAFVSRGAAPAILPGRSLAWQSFITISQHVRSLAREHLDVTPDDKDDTSYKDAATLHSLDPSIPSDPKTKPPADAAD